MKKCIRCGELKPIEQYYKHPQMADGHLNKCKYCAKLDTKKRHEKLLNNPEWVEFERSRGREKHKRLYSKALKLYVHKYNDGKTWAERFPEKREASNKSQKMKKPFTGAEKHHWSYNEIHFKDVIWITKQEHMKAHRFIVYDQERKMYRRYDTNELLDTKERHLKFITDCITNKED